jgi:hypothetical protein
MYITAHMLQGNSGEEVVKIYSIFSLDNSEMQSRPETWWEAPMEGSVLSFLRAE